MGSLYRWVFDHGISRMDPERAHYSAVQLASKYPAVPGLTRVVHATMSGARPAKLPRVFGMEVPSLVGLAAGFDKNGEAIDGLAPFGFGAIEIGTVTAQSQPGNEKPRVFRLPRDEAVINRMGFNNDGAQAVANRLAQRHVRQTASTRPTVGDGKAGGALLGINIGKSKLTPAEKAIDDYRYSARLLAPYADYIVINVSSPNTPGLRDLQAVESLRPIASATLDAVAETAEGWALPVMIKIAPDLVDDDVRAVAGMVKDLGLAGVVATNTTTAREGLSTPLSEVRQMGAGGLSGPVLQRRSREVLDLLRDELDDESTVFSVGGIGDAAEARRRFEAGADFVQIYTGLIYQGPRLVFSITADSSGV